MKRRSYDWKGPECIIPGHGLAETGKPIVLPVDVGDKLVDQQLATVTTSKRVKRNDNQEV